MSCAMAVLRFVNGVTDVHQTGQYAQSVQEIADKINIPDWMVDLRHESAHGKLPSFDLLKQGLMIALTWLDENYWQETAQKLHHKEREFAQNTKRGMEEYTELVIDILQSAFNKNTHKSVKDQNRIRTKRVEKCGEIVRQTQKFVNVGNIKQFIGMLLQEGNFVFTLKQIESLDIPISLPDCHFDESAIAKIISMADVWKVFTDAFVQQYPSFTVLLAQQLVNTAQKNESSSTHVCYLVAMFVLFQCSKDVGNTLLKYMLRKPSRASHQFLRVIVEEGDLSEDTKSKLAGFLDIFTPAIHVLRRPQSEPFDTRKLHTMGTEASKLGLETLLKLREDAESVSVSVVEQSPW